jgi:hypothetical protein
MTWSDDETPVARCAAAGLMHGGGGVASTDGEGDGLDGAVAPGEGRAAVPQLQPASAQAVASARTTRFGLNLSSGPRECGAWSSSGGSLPAGWT